MGAWDVSVFGNDTAADFMYEFDDVNTVAEVAMIIENALDTILNSNEEVDGADGATGLAAAALVAAWKKPEVLEDDEDYAPKPWPRTHDPLPTHIVAKAVAVLDRMQIQEGNELAELWSEAGQAEEFATEISRWRSHLS